VGVSADEKSSQPNVPMPTPGNPYDHVQSAITALKSQHAALRGLISLVDNSLPIVHESPLPASVVEQSEGLYTPVQFGGPIARKAWMSTTTSLSDGGSVWFDAVDEVDGAEEFFLDTTLSKASQCDGQIPDFGGQNNSHSFHDESDTDEEQEAARLSLAISDRGVVASARQVAHRMSLPSGPVADEGSLFAVFKNNVGKVQLTHMVSLFISVLMSTWIGSCQRSIPCDIQRAPNASSTNGRRS
jgi:oxysterol-binding protein-related protein 3/6/7